MQNLNGKRVVITGGSQGLGLAYGFRNESEILPLDVTYDPKSTAIPRTQ